MKQRRLLFTLAFGAMTFFGSCTSDNGEEVSEPKAFLMMLEKIDFGAVPIGSESIWNLTLINEGRLPVEIESIALSATSEVFEIENATFTLGNYEERAVAVYFRPIELGIFRAEAIIRHNGFNQETGIVKLEGKGAWNEEVDPITIADAGTDLVDAGN